MNKKGFTLVELLAVVVIIGVISGLALFAVTRSMQNSRARTFIEDARTAVSAVRQDVLSVNPKPTSYDGDISVYELDTINEFLTKKISASPFGGNYISASVRVEPSNSLDSDTYKFYICMIDSDGNGFDYTGEGDLSVDGILYESSDLKCTGTSNPNKVTVIVNNGQVVGASTTYVAYNATAIFTIKPNIGYSGGTASCTNNAVGSIVGNLLKVTRVTADTVCTVTLESGVPYNVVYDSNGGDALMLIDDRDDYPWESVNGVIKSPRNLSGLLYGTTTTISSKDFTLTATDTLRFQWAISAEEYYDSQYGSYMYYSIYKNGTLLDGTGSDTKITGGGNIGYESSLNYTTVSKSLDAGTYKIQFTYYKGPHYATTDPPVGLDRGFIKNVDLVNNSFSMPNTHFNAKEEKALSKNKYVKPGYTFAGWSKAQAAATPSYTDEQVVKNLTSSANSNLTLYAIWNKITEYNVGITVTNGTVSGDSTKTVHVGDKPTFTINPNTDFYKGSVTCTNSHTGTLSSDAKTVTIGKGSYGYITSGIYRETTCTVALKRSTNFSYTSSTGSSYYYSSCCGSAGPASAFSTETGQFTVTGTIVDSSHDTSAIHKYCVSYYGNNGDSCSTTGTTMYYYSGCTSAVSTSDSNQCGCTGIMCNAYISYTQYVSNAE